MLEHYGMCSVMSTSSISADIQWVNREHEPSMAREALGVVGAGSVFLHLVASPIAVMGE
jgi:hypothetical protein